MGLKRKLSARTSRFTKQDSDRDLDSDHIGMNTDPFGSPTSRSFSVMERHKKDAGIR